MRAIFIATLSFLAASSAAARQDGEWSEVVGGVRGRLSVEFTGAFAGRENAIVYLELQNVTDVMGPLELLYDESRAFHWQLLDKSGTPVPQPGFMVASIMTSMPYPVALPMDSTLRFRVSTSGYGIKPSGGVVIQLHGGFWQFHRAAGQTYSLGAMFTAKSGGTSGHRSWSGALTLPPVKIPETKK